VPPYNALTFRFTLAVWDILALTNNIAGQAVHTGGCKYRNRWLVGGGHGRIVSWSLSMEWHWHFNGIVPY